MDKTTLIVGAIVLVVAAGLGVYLLSSQTPTTTTETPTTETPDTTTSPTPGAPVATTDSFVVPTDTSAVVTGSITPHGALTSYWYEFGTTPSLGSKSTTQNVGSGYISIPSPAYIVGLTKSTTYYYRVVAQNSFGSVAGVQRTFVTTSGTPAPVGSAPRSKTLAATGVARTAANISGEVTPNSATTQYWFEYGTSADLGNTTPFVSVGDGTAAVAASQSLSNLAPLTTYYYRVNAQNQFGTTNGSIMNFKTTGPAAATAPGANTIAPTLVTATSATLRGSVSPNGADVTYWFEYSTDANFVSSLLNGTTHLALAGTLGGTSVTAPITGLTANTTYYARLVVQNNIGTVRGDRVTFKTK